VVNTTERRPVADRFSGEEGGAVIVGDGVEADIRWQLLTDLTRT